MINYTTMVTKKIDEEDLFERILDSLLNEDIDDETLVLDLPKDVQRLVFAKIGAMMIDYAGREDF